MIATVKILYPSRTAAIIEPSGREVWNPDGPTPWVHVGTETVEMDDTVVGIPDAIGLIADTVFARWNRGSGAETDTFLAACRRSLSVGDMIVVPEFETALRCASFGWDPASAPSADQITSTGEDLMDIDYLFRRRTTEATS